CPFVGQRAEGATGVGRVPPAGWKARGGRASGGGPPGGPCGGGGPAPAAPPSARPVSHWAWLARVVVCAYGRATVGTRSVKVCRRQEGVSQKKRRTWSERQTGRVAQGRSASVRRSSLCMRVAGCAQVGQGAVGAVTFTSRVRPWSSSVRVSTWSGDGRRRAARSFNNNTGSFFP